MGLGGLSAFGANPGQWVTLHVQTGGSDQEAGCPPYSAKANVRGEACL